MSKKEEKNTAVETKKVTIEEVRAMFRTLHNAVIDLGDENLLKSMQVDAMGKGFRSKLLGEAKAKTSTESKPFVAPAKL